MKLDADWPASTLQHQSFNRGLRFWEFSCHAFLQRPNLYHHRSLRVQQPRRGHVDVGGSVTGNSKDFVRLRKSKKILRGSAHNSEACPPLQAIMSIAPSWVVQTYVHAPQCRNFSKILRFFLSFLTRLRTRKATQTQCVCCTKLIRALSMLWIHMDLREV